VLGTATACFTLLVGTFCCHVFETEELEGIKNTKIFIVKAKKKFRETNFGVSSPNLYNFHIRVSNEARPF
jgi:hypothetical protein